MRVFIIGVAVAAATLAAGASFGQTSKGEMPKAFGVECRGEFVVLGLYAIRRSAVLGVNLERNQATGELMYGLITFNGHKGVEQLIVGVEDFRPIIECVGN